MGLLKRGIDWFQQVHTTSESETVTVEMAGGVLKTVQATVVAPESYLNSEGVRIQSDHYMFLIVETPDLDFRPGVKIRRHLYPDLLYDVVRPNRSTKEYNDPNNSILAVPAKICYSQT